MLSTSVKTPPSSHSIANSILAVSLVTTKTSNDLTSSLTITNTTASLHSKPTKGDDENNKKSLHISTTSSVSSSSNFSSQSTSPSSSSFTYIHANQINNDLPLNTSTRLNSDILLNSSLINENTTSLFKNFHSTVSSSTAFKSSLRARKVLDENSFCINWKTLKILTFFFLN